MGVLLAWSSSLRQLLWGSLICEEIVALTRGLSELVFIVSLDRALISCAGLRLRVHHRIASIYRLLVHLRLSSVNRIIGVFVSGTGLGCSTRWLGRCRGRTTHFRNLSRRIIIIIYISSSIITIVAWMMLELILLTLIILLHSRHSLAFHIQISVNPRFYIFQVTRSCTLFLLHH